MALTQQVDELAEEIPTQSPLFHYDKETNLISTIDKQGQKVQVDINEMPETLQQKILDLEEKAVGKLNEALE